MTFEVEINGRSRTVSIERAGRERFRVTVDGVASLVDAQRTGAFGLSLLFPEPRIESVPCSWRRAVAGELLAYLAGRSLVVTVNGRRTGRAARCRRPARRAESGRADARARGARAGGAG